MGGIRGLKESATATMTQAPTQAPLIPVILCGGTGTRLWPLSRATYPKQYWALAGGGEETLLQQGPVVVAGQGPVLLGIAGAGQGPEPGAGAAAKDDRNKRRTGQRSVRFHGDCV